VRARPERISALDGNARSLFLNTHARNRYDPLVSRFERSLLLARVPDPDELIASFTSRCRHRELDARLTCSRWDCNLPFQ